MFKRHAVLGVALPLVGAVLLSVPTTTYAANTDMQGSSRSGTAESKSMKCKMRFDLSGWSIIYKTASGAGTVRCSNGERMRVKLDIKGGGLTAGKYKLNNAHGTFSHVTKISQVLGSYASATAHAGVVGSSRAMVMTNGPVSLAIGGTGTGWDLGAGFSSFTISRIK